MLEQEFVTGGCEAQAALLAGTFVWLGRCSVVRVPVQPSPAAAFRANPLPVKPHRSGVFPAQAGVDRDQALAHSAATIASTLAHRPPPVCHADGQLAQLQALIEGGEGLGLHLEQVEILKANVEVGGLYQRLLASVQPCLSELKSDERDGARGRCLSR